MRLPLVGVSALLLGLLPASACTREVAPTPPATTASPTSAATTARPSSTRTPTRPDARRLDAALERVARQHPDSEVAVAWAPVGTKGRPHVVGDPTRLVAWSTIKVPLALAVVRAGHGEEMTDDIDRALRASDNEAATRLWERLGGGSRASEAVGTQLRRGGDRTTDVPAEVTVPGYSPFGQSSWALTAQTRFTAALPCLTGSASVTDAMGRVSDGQRWGLGGIKGARYKGGWGSTPGGYVVRQLGIVPGTKGDTAVTLQVRTGTHEQGTAIADELVAALRGHRDGLPVGTCR
ncbi:MAG: hypothetical protein C0493_07525 [Kytococcus sp.]|nr:hypothetical protein [Kytococcus sp.]